MRPYAELSPDSTALEVRFEYDPTLVSSIRNVPGAKFVGREEGGPHWRVPARMDAARALRRAMGPQMKLGPRALSWGRAAKREEDRIDELVRAQRAELPTLAEELPELHSLVTQRAYQTVDIAIMAQTNLLNANHAGTGKTVECLGAIAEAGMLEGAHLILTPATSIEPTWGEELSRHGQPHPVLAYGDVGPRRRSIKEAARLHAAGEPFFLVMNFEQARRKMKDRKATPHLTAPELGEITWDSVTIDEVHKSGLCSPSSAFSFGMRKINVAPGGRRWAMSGTPLGGKPIKMWGFLNWLNPQAYPSRWDWAKNWLEVSSNGFGNDYGAIRNGMGDSFYREHSRVMVRRQKLEALPGLPAKMQITVPCSLTAGQKKQYQAMQKSAEVKIEEESLGALGVLAEYTRLKQFANARQTLRREGETLHVEPTHDSGKLQTFLEKLAECGVEPGSDGDSSQQAIVASESAKFIRLVHETLVKKGYNAELIVGGKKRSETAETVRRFARNEVSVVCMSTTAGGVSLNMGTASSVHLLDETWNPDDQSQLADRADRGNRTTPLTVYTYRTKGTIQEYIADVCEGKRLDDLDLLDVHRKVFMAMGA